MGWKALKDAYDIKHIVCVTEKGICIGSGYAHDLAVINPSTGELADNQTFSGFTKRFYPELANATPEELLSLIQQVDTFSAAIPVYTYCDGEIIEKRCEVAGWPNTTHDGLLMYENTFSTDKKVVIAWAKRNARSLVRHTAEYIVRLQQQLADAQAELLRAEGFVAKLQADYPETEPAAS